MRSVRIPAFAKINLRLDILGRRADGYHELRTIFQAVSLHDDLKLTRSRAPGIQLESDDAALPTGRENLVWRAIEAMRRELGMRGGVRARLKKRIPVGRGLGGGSSDAAAALIGMLRLTGAQVSLARLMKVAASLGADVPFFLIGGRAAGVGRGDEIYPLPDAPKRTVLIVSPADIAVSTREAYRWASVKLTKQRVASKLPGFCALCWSPLYGVRPGGRRASGPALSNDFEKAVFARHPRLARIKQGLLRRGAAEAALAGSGSAVFGVFRNPAQARRAAQGFPGDQVFVARTLTRGEHLRALRWDGVA